MPISYMPRELRAAEAALLTSELIDSVQLPRRGRPASVMAPSPPAADDSAAACADFSAAAALPRTRTMAHAPPWACGRACAHTKHTTRALPIQI